jgi:hypothetical protein
MRIWQIEFPSTVETYPVGAVFDREDAAHVPMPAADRKLDNPTQRIH